MISGRIRILQLWQPVLNPNNKIKIKAEIVTTAPPVRPSVIQPKSMAILNPDAAELIKTMLDSDPPELLGDIVHER